MCVHLLSHSVLSNSCDPMYCSPPGSSVYGDSLGKNSGVGCMPSSRRSSQPRDWTQVSLIAGGFFTIWVTGKPKNNEVGSLSLLQGSSQARNWTRISIIAGEFFISWAIPNAKLLCLLGWSLWIWHFNRYFLFKLTIEYILRYIVLCSKNVLICFLFK